MCWRSSRGGASGGYRAGITDGLDSGYVSGVIGNEDNEAMELEQVEGQESSE